MKPILPILLSSVMTGACALADTAPAPRPPNFIILFADDLGYGDLGCYGHPSIRTPELDRLATEGLKFTDFYVAASVCTPSRAGLLTGRLPIRSGMAGNPTGGAGGVLYPDSDSGLPTTEITMATALRAQGYATACIGKWHLGHLPPFLPTSHGFDTYFGIPYSNDMNHVGGPGRRRHPDSMDPQGKIAWWNEPLMRNEEVIERPVDQHTLTLRYTEESIRFIEANQDRPFFLYLPYAMPHVPLFASDRFHDQSPRGRYGDTVEEIDWSAGEIVRTLRRLGLAENTLVIFTSDNGPWLRKEIAGGSAGLLRDGKGGTWEGGFRVPAIAWWPGTISPQQVNRGIASTMDLFTTFLSLAGAAIPADRTIDGVDLSPMLRGSGDAGCDTFYFYRGPELYAVRKGPYKAHFQTFYGYSGVPAEKHDPPQLYHLGHDPGENYNIASQHPDVLAELQAIARQHLASVVPGEPQVHRPERPPQPAAAPGPGMAP
jgi:arylsulfatase A-like enzyme